MRTRWILAAAILAVAFSALTHAQATRTRNLRVVDASAQDEERLKQMVREWADAVVHNDLQKLDTIQAEDFKGATEGGKNFDKRMLREALKSGTMKVAAWTIEDVKVNIRGAAATVTGKSTLTNATFMGQDFSGEYEWTDRFVRQKNGNWRAVSSQSKRVKKE
ncbi:MAG TPA: nuclear transport factor 2 family protein [Pyrinomonadaceae bacterium]|jgi:ketosteroid isomerase-like protein|nr:nuclear transport factor 2 family protein [Pyrinomonadaceae bacterium]